MKGVAYYGYATNKSAPPNNPTQQSGKDTTLFSRHIGIQRSALVLALSNSTNTGLDAFSPGEVLSYCLTLIVAIQGCVCDRHIAYSLA